MREPAQQDLRPSGSDFDSPTMQHALALFEPQSGEDPIFRLYKSDVVVEWRHAQGVEHRSSSVSVRGLLMDVWGEASEQELNGRKIDYGPDVLLPALVVLAQAVRTAEIAQHAFNYPSAGSYHYSKE